MEKYEMKKWGDGMPRHARTISKTGIYHVMIRGANRQEIFHDEEDRYQFLETLKKYKQQANLKVYAWCLMNNHVHLLLREGIEKLSVTMKRIGVSYVQYYHRKYFTTGHLFQDRFKSEDVETKQYFLTVVRYIHQNPIKARIVRHMEEWKWSSCQSYYGYRHIDSDFLDHQVTLRLFSRDVTVAIEKFREFNERLNEDSCLDEEEAPTRLTDDDARVLIKEMLGSLSIAQVKSLPKSKRDPLLRNMKTIKGLPQRQIARILGVSKNLINRA
ncbi:transposase [Solibacillus silvestris]|uniref:transposase n=1 Tax=Solibacillus silvestris TaxID=76853 RepID=UPI003F7CDCA0